MRNLGSGRHRRPRRLGLGAIEINGDATMGVLAALAIGATLVADPGSPPVTG